MATNKSNLKNKHRLIGIWLLIMFALFIGGLLPLYFEPLDLLRGYTAFYNNDDIPVIIISAFLSISLIIASVLTLGGWAIGRKSFLFFVLLRFLQDGIDTFSWGTRIPNDIDSWLRYIVDFGFPLLCIWYFNKPLTKEFFKK